MRWYIEFRNGWFFQTLEADFGGPLETAMSFDSKVDTVAFMDANNWIYFNGGMALER